MDDENKNNNNENSNKNKNKRIYVLGSILLVLIVFLIVGGIKFFRETKEAKEKMANEEYHNLIARAFRVFGIIAYRAGW